MKIDIFNPVLKYRDVFKVLGMEDNQIDYAVPEKWANNNPQLAPHCVWDYRPTQDNPNNIFGQPLDMRPLIQRARKILRKEQVRSFLDSIANHDISVEEGSELLLEALEGQVDPTLVC